MSHPLTRAIQVASARGPHKAFRMGTALQALFHMAEVDPKKVVDARLVDKRPALNPEPQRIAFIEKTAPDEVTVNYFDYSIIGDRGDADVRVVAGKSPQSFPMSNIRAALDAMLKINLATN